MRTAGPQRLGPGHLIREYHVYAPICRDPQCPRDYVIKVFTNGSWQCVAELKDNNQRLRRHEFSEAVTTEKLRVVVTATNGDPSAAIYELRCL